MSLKDILKDKEKIDYTSATVRGRTVDEIVESIRSEITNDERVKTYILTKDEIEKILEEKLIRYLGRKKMMLNDDEIKSLQRIVFDEIFGLGILEDLINREDVINIFIRNTEVTYDTLDGELHRHADFKNIEEVEKIKDKILAQKNKTVTPSHPMCDLILYNGSRVNITLPTVADRLAMTIRNLNLLNETLNGLYKREMMTEDMKNYIKEAIINKKNILISGSTETGKTTLANSILKEVPPDERISIIEDTPELKLRRNNVDYLRVRESDRDGVENVTQDRLLKNTLRFTPKRIVLGEVRDPRAAFALINTLNTGHPGSICTIHASSPVDALNRLRTYAIIASNIPVNTMSVMIYRAIDIIIQLVGGAKEKRRITEIVELEKKLEPNSTFITRKVF
ncbi:MAG: Flp pilus assembly complex ATPase component TadA [Actinobacteria bacterium]|nr:Flp pilus assembly complex ATPase component TadA [Actinomycetota bacterium]